ncbi:MAG: DUF1611 domain-containing protein [Rhodobacteraceae bacterium]|nr:DUF1611 domain-containing protein [Paracoccaceae bacterium]
MIKYPYHLFIGDAQDKAAAKVARGIKDWRPDRVVGQISLPGCQTDLGIDELTVEDAVKHGARTLVIGVANRGGFIAESWKPVLIGALEAGMDLASGLHNLLQDEPDIVAAAERCGCQLHDVRVPRAEYPIANGQRRSGKRCLGVGTDVSVGKMYTMLAMHREMASRGIQSTFRATGQTGILIEGNGVPLDAVVADFMAGSIEWLTPANENDHWDMVEGQGSLFHASYSGVTLALIHGAQPDALILCHDASRHRMRGLSGYRLPTLTQLSEVALTMAQMVNPDCRVIGVSINTSELSERDAAKMIEDVGKDTGLPTTDPFRYGPDILVDALIG